jgi:hypothetical protein
MKDLFGHVNGDASEEHVSSSKRRREKVDGGSDRWNSESLTVDNKDLDKSSKSKGLVESKSKSSRKDLNVGSVESKRKSEKDSGRREGHHQVKDKDVKESKEKDRASDREKKVHTDSGDVMKKQGSKSVDLVEDKQHKRGRENTDFSIQDDLRNPELEKELEKRIRRRGDGSVEKEKYQEEPKEIDDRRLSSRSEHSKDAKYKESRHKDDKYREEADKDIRQKDDKYRDDDEKERKHKESKYKDDRYRDDSDKDKSRRKADKYREDADRDSRRRDDKYRDDIENNDDRYKDESYKKEESYKDNRHKSEKYSRDDTERDRDSSRHKGEDVDREKRARDSKYRDREREKERHGSRERGSEPDSKRARDEGNNIGDYKKSNARDSSPVYDDRASRYNKDDIRNDDVRARGVKEKLADVDKRSVSAGKIELGTDRGRPLNRNADVDVSVNHGHRRSSPNTNSHTTRDHHYRNSKQDDMKYRDYNYDERNRHHIPSNREFSGTGQAEKKSNQKSDGGHVGDSSADNNNNNSNSNINNNNNRRMRSDTRGSPMQLVDKSPSSTSNDRRHFNRPDTRRSLDIDENLGQRKDKETHQNDETSQVDSENSFRSNHFPGNNSRALLPPPPPYRSDGSSSAFGPSDDKPMNNNNNNRHRNMGRSQGNTWKNVQTWPSPVPNGFMNPYQHGPPPVGFHPVMQPFAAPPIFSRPPMELSHTVPYHARWRNPVDDTCPPMWDPNNNNNVFGDYGRLDWDHSRTHQMNNVRGWESDGWKLQQKNKMGADVPPSKDESLTRGSNDEVSDHRSPSEQDIPLDEAAIEEVDMTIADTVTTDDSYGVSKVSVKNDAFFCRVYLSKIDISADLARPELYEKCTSLMDIDQETQPDDEEYPKILYLEEVGEAKLKVPGKTSSASLFATLTDSIYQKAISLYKKQREETRAMNKDQQVLFPISVDPTPTQISQAENKNNPGDPSDEPNPTISPKVEPVEESEKVEEPMPTLVEVKMEVDLVEVKPSIESLTEKNCGGTDGTDVPHGDVSVNEGCEEMVTGESIESGSVVNLSRILHSAPESTH